MERFAKVVNSFSSFSKLKLFSQYQLFTFTTFLNKSLFFTPEVTILYKKYSVPGGRGPWILIYPRYAVILFL